nr:Gag-Pol polyprotein [Tanacetum cinerariifolium]
RQANVPQADRTVTTSNQLDLLFSPMFDELLNGLSKVVSKSSDVSAADAPNQQTHDENDQVANDEFINIFSTPVQDQGETSSRHIHQSPRGIFINQAKYAQEILLKHDMTVTTSDELDLLFSLMFDELLNGSSKVVSKSSAEYSADAPNQRQHHTTPLNNHTTPVPTCQVPSLAPTVSSSENINQAESYAENDQVADDEFINIFYHPLEQVIGNPSQSVRTRRQLESDAEMCMLALTVSRTEPKNIKEAMADSAWIESI